MRNRSIRFVAIGALLALMAAALPIGITAQIEPTSPRDCMNLKMVDHTEVLDDRNILFVARPRDISQHLAGGMSRIADV